MKNSKAISLVFVCMIMLTTVQANGLYLDGCIAILQSKSGIVEKKKTHILKFKSTAEEMIVRLDKKSGEAKSIVKIYIDGIPQKNIKFSAGKLASSKSRSFRNAQDKLIKVEIVNLSAHANFEYAMTIKGITNTLGKEDFELKPQAKKILYTSKACNEEVIINLTRKTGKAKTTVYIYRGNTKVWEGVWNSDQTSISKSFSNSVNKKYKIEIKNISTQAIVDCSLTATQL